VSYKHDTIPVTKRKSNKSVKDPANKLQKKSISFSFEAGNWRISPAIAIKSPAMNFPSMV
jgi:hypothetical protein